MGAGRSSDCLMMEDEKLLMEQPAIRLSEQTTLAKSLVISGHPFDLELDARQLACPLPVLRAKKSLSQLSSGEVLKAVATDKGSLKDFEEFCRQTGNVLLSSTTQGGEFVFLIRRR
jgi:tRNA 2-thiouridine synthesizing protein A